MSTLNCGETIKDTGNFFVRSDEPSLNEPIEGIVWNKNKNENAFIKLMKLPVQLYKIAASILVTIGLFAIVYSSVPHKINNFQLSYDTIIIHKTDTLYSKLTDTVNIIKTVYVLRKENRVASGSMLSGTKNKYDCKKELCPDEVDEIKELTYNNNISKDTSLKDFIVSLN